MSSAVESLLDGDATGLGPHSRYRSGCACCAPEPVSKEGKPQRRAVNRPVLAWRTRLATQQELAEEMAEAGH